MKIKPGDKIKFNDGEVRVMAVAEGWAMVRFKGAMPFCATLKELERGISDRQIAVEKFEGLLKKVHPNLKRG